MENINETGKGLAAVSAAANHAMLIIPGRRKGHLQIVDLDSLGYYWSALPQRFSSDGDTKDKTITSAAKATPTANVSIIAAHSGNLSCIALNEDGTKCATASDKGTLIRVFNTATGTLLNELRRGVDRAEIYSLAFNNESTRLCVSSDKGTIHIFNLDPSVVTMVDRRPRGPTYGEVVVYPQTSVKRHGLTNSGNRGSSLSFMKDLLPKYFSSEWSFAHAKILTESKCIAAFGEQKNSVVGMYLSIFVWNYRTSCQLNVTNSHLRGWKLLQVCIWPAKRRRMQPRILWKIFKGRSIIIYYLLPICSKLIYPEMQANWPPYIGVHLAQSCYTWYLKYKAKYCFH